MVDKQHWETVYRKKAAEAVSWYCPHLDISLALIDRALPDRIEQHDALRQRITVAY